MSKTIENILANYLEMKMELSCIGNELLSFRGISDEDIIDTIVFNKVIGNPVQTSEMSDKTATCAINYKEKTDRINKDWIEYLEKKHAILEYELILIESAINSLSDFLPDFIYDMIIEKMTWDQLAIKYHVSRTMVGRYRKKAIKELDLLFTLREAETIKYLLS